MPCEANRSTAPPSVAPKWFGHRWLMPALLGLALLVLGVTGFYFHEPLRTLFAAPAPTSVPQDEPLKVLGPSLVSIRSDTPLNRRLHVVAVQRETLDYPLLNVTGFVMARYASAPNPADGGWDFASPEVATAYGDWRNARADVLVLAKQAEKTRELVDVQVKYLKTELDRKESGYAMGAVPLRDLVTAKADYLKAELQGQKDQNEAESALKKAERNRGLLERQLFQAGVDPEVVRKTTAGLLLIGADVPEAKVGVVKVGQPCEARFVGVPDKVYKASVGRIGPSVSKEKRTLRVTFVLTNPSNQLLPGMFADIGLGTQARSVLTVPAEAVLHAGHSDYVMKEESSGQYRAVEIKADEARLITHANGSHNGNVACIPVAEGLHEGDRVIGAGAILLKPIMAKALESH